MNKNSVNPLISIITVVLNDEKNIENTIRSVIDQEHENIQYIFDDEIWNTYDSTIGCRTLVSNRSLINGNNNYSILRINEVNKNLIISWGSTFESCYNIIVEKLYRPLGLVNCLN